VSSPGGTASTGPDAATTTSMTTADSDRAGRLAALASFAATPYPTLDDAIDQTLRLVADVTGARLAMLHRLEGDSLIVSHACDRMGVGILPPLTVPRADTFCDDVLRSLSPLLVADADADPVRRTLRGKRLVGTRTYVGVPIVLGEGRPFGTLCAHDRRVLDLGDAEIDAMRVLARLLASEIERDRAVARAAAAATDLAARHAELADAYRQLDALREAVESISSDLDLRSLLGRIVAAGVALLGAHAGAIALLGDGPDAPRRLVATHNLPAADLEARAIPGNRGLMGEILARRGPVVVASYDDLQVPLPDPAFHALAPWIGAPIWWQGEIVGTFGIAAADPERRFDRRDADLLGLLGRHAALAIENARLYAASRDHAVLEERNRLAREIHDTLAQSLVTLTFTLRAARGAVWTDPARADGALAEAEAMTRSALDEARRSVWDLGPAALEGRTLVDALRAEAEPGPGRAGPPVRLVVSGAVPPLPAAAQLALLRTAQEGIANVRRHAEATAVELRLHGGEHEVALTVADDGRGFDPAAAAAMPARSDGGAGLAGLRARLRDAGGNLDVESAPGAGARLTARVPLRPPPTLSSAPAPRRPIPAAWGTSTPGTDTDTDTDLDAGASATQRVDAAPGARGRAPLRVVLADDHPAVRAGLAALLAAAPDIVVVGEAGDGETAARLVAAHRPAVAALDLRMPAGGVAAIERILGLGLSTRVLVVTSLAGDDAVLQALQAGASGVVLKDAGGDELVAAVRAVGGGGGFLGPELAARLAGGLTGGVGGPSRPERLTPREREVLALLGAGCADKEIATRLGLRPKTARYHVANVLAKLGAGNRTDAVRLAYQRGLLTP
jgi:signal transduction histidine kinase/DNA-binding NarL/FixJ family response regulator